MNAHAADFEEEEQAEAAWRWVPISKIRHDVVVDVVAPGHVEIHARLERWGAWNQEKRGQDTCLSIESRYREKTPIATGTDVAREMVEMERAVLRTPDPYRTLIRMFYVSRATPSFICKALALSRPLFPAFTFRARSMVINILRQVVV